MKHGTSHVIEVHPFIGGRWSPYGFDSRPVPEEDLTALFEAARHAPSSMNEQPWRFIVARREETEPFARVLSCLTEGNQVWARHVPVLVLTVAKLRFARNDKPNRTALHDLGLAAAALSFEAEARDLSVHQMGGIHQDRIREIYGIPEGWEPVTAIAIGYRAERTDIPENLRERDRARRGRKELKEIVFAERWEKPAAWVVA